MGESLISIISIHSISPSIFSSILTTAYQRANDLNSPSTLLLLSDAARDTLRQYTMNSVTHPPIDSSFTSPFHGWSVCDVAQFLSENAEGSIVEPRVFLIADEKTGEDGDTLLLVHNLGHRQGQCKSEFTIKHVRLAAEYVNTEAVAVSIATSGVDELLSLADEDGVFRGGSGDGGGQQPPRKGGQAPKKQISQLHSA